MILYHFTALEYLDTIKASGLTKGDVPLSPTEGINGVWLTSDPEPDGHGLSDGKTLTDEDRLAYFRAFNIMPAQGSRVLNKRAVRITVELPKSDNRLSRWEKWGRKRLPPEWYARLSATGGGKEKTWYIFFGTIPPDAFIAVENLTDGTPRAI